VSGANSPYLDSLFQLTAFQNGVKVGTSAQINSDGTISITYNDVTKRFDISATGSLVSFDAVKSALAAADSAVDFNGQELTGIAGPTSSTSAVSLGYLESLMGTTVTKSITLSANNTTATVDLFTVTGVGIIITKLVGVVTTQIGSNHTGSQLVAYDGSTTVDVSSTGASPLSGAQVGALVAGVSTSSPIAIVDRANVSASDSTPDVPYITLFTAASGTTKIQYKYTTTNTPTSGAITWYLTYTPIANGAAGAA
jgi:surface antigen